MCPAVRGHPPAPAVSPPRSLGEEGAKLRPCARSTDELHCPSLPPAPQASEHPGSSLRGWRARQGVGGIVGELGHLDSGVTPVCQWVSELA